MLVLIIAKRKMSQVSKLNSRNSFSTLPSKIWVKSDFIVSESSNHSHFKNINGNGEYPLGQSICKCRKKEGIPLSIEDWQPENAHDYLGHPTEHDCVDNREDSTRKHPSIT